GQEVLNEPDIGQREVCSGMETVSPHNAGFAQQCVARWFGIEVQRNWILLSVVVVRFPEALIDAIRILCGRRYGVSESIELDNLAVHYITRLETKTERIDHRSPGHCNDHVRFEKSIDEVGCSRRGRFEPLRR